MYWSRSFITTLKEAPESAESVSHKLMLRSGLVRMLIAGVYSYLPLGYRVLSRIEHIIREEMDRTGAQEVLLPSLQSVELWQKTGRDALMGETMIRFEDRRGRKLCLGPTHEEVVTELAASQVKSWRDLPFTLYQIQTKFRDELRPRFGVVRSCEFIMKDAYSFDRGTEGLDKIYETMRRAYETIFKRCGLDFVSIKADSGVIGGDISHEFLVPAESGEDMVYRCRICKAVLGAHEVEIEECPHCHKDMEKLNALEVGHIFKLGDKYSKSLGVKFLDESGQQQVVQMGCYGIGVSRLIAAIVEQNHDENGAIWPVEVAPFGVLIVPVNVGDKLIWDKAVALHDRMVQEGLEVLLDDRDERAGVKFKDADLIGVPLRITVGTKWTKEGKLEIKDRRTGAVTEIAGDDTAALFNLLRS
ncbi:MAG: proline--tRNA ligase [Candidatus Omnitrophica bacterium]|nr:proline--tRNA ligase [Candidatus Omnitrophota bacterium]MDD5574151.1 proline--tRNA ligase [Candidatus Omnitrophota bacterium]